MTTAGATPATDAAKAAAGAEVDAAALVASTDVEARIIEKAAVVAADMLAAKRKNWINSIWEFNQAALALISVVAADIACVFILWAAREKPEASPLRIAALVALTSSASLVIGFYFGRTNHARPTPTHPYGDE